MCLRFTFEASIVEYQSLIFRLHQNKIEFSCSKNWGQTFGLSHKRYLTSLRAVHKIQSQAVLNTPKYTCLLDRLWTGENVHTCECYKDSLSWKRLPEVSKDLFPGGLWSQACLSPEPKTTWNAVSRADVQVNIMQHRTSSVIELTQLFWGSV